MHISQTSWRATIARHQNASALRAIWQLINTGVPYLGLWYLMYLAQSVSWWLS